MTPRLRALWNNLVHRNRTERDLDDELRTAFELLVEDGIRRGLDSQAARRAATLRLGRVESVKTQVRQARAGALIDTFAQDARYGARLLCRQPLFSLTAVLSLAICLAANTTVFTIANRLLFRQASGVVDPGGLVDIAPVRRDGSFTEPVLPYRAYDEIRRQSRTLESVYGYQLDISPMSLRGPEAAERVFGTTVTSTYFTALGVRPAAGRLVGPSDSEAPGASPLVVLGHGFWIRRFNGDPSIVGQTLHINGRPLTVVGVTPADFHGLSVVIADVWLPVGAILPAGQSPAETRLAVGGRLRAGVSIDQAAAEIQGLGLSLQPEMVVPDQAAVGVHDDGGGGLRVVAASPVPAVVRVAIYAFLVTLMVLAAVVLAIACANVAGVLLARATARRREIAVRLAIGAGRARLIRQLLTETMLLFAAGGALGLALARVMTSLIVLALPTLPVPIDTSLPLDGRVIAFTAAAALLAALISGLTPALQASKADVVSALKAESQAGPDRLRLRSVFVVAQVAFSIVLVIGAGLLVRSLQRSGSVDLGFDSRGVEVATLDLSLAQYSDRTGPDFIADVLGRLRATSGVSAASVATSLPLGGVRRDCCGVEVPGVAPPAGEQFFQPFWNTVGPGYFDTLRIRVLDGRDFSAADRAGTERVAIVSRSAARQFWPGERAVGRHVIWQRMPRLFARGAPGPPSPPSVPTIPLSVVGVVADIASGRSAAAPMVYVPFAQNYDADIALVARSAAGRRLTTEVGKAIAATNPNLPIVAASRLADQSSPVLTQLRVAAAVAGTVGLIAILLAGIGLYGLTAYMVTQRTREIGIRIAMGAQRIDVIRLVLRQGMSLVLVGSGLGLLLAGAGSRLLSRLLFGVPPLDPVTFGATTLLFALIGLAACYVPTRRAIHVNATEALRYE
jgi:predicted permease